MNTHRNSPEFETGNRHNLELNQEIDTKAFFPWPEQDQLLETIHRLADNADEVILILGPTGAGKTTFSCRIHHEAPDHWFFCRIDAHPLLHIYQLLQDLAQQIGLELDLMVDADSDDLRNADNVVINNEETGILTTTHPPALLDETYIADKLHECFSNLRLQGRLPVVLIDDADQIPTATLATLLRLHERIVEELHVFTLIILAQPKIDATLTADDSYVAGTSNFHHLKMPTLTLEQMELYTRHFLLLNGFRRIPRWKADRFTSIHLMGQGLPGDTNVLIKTALSDDAKQPRPSAFQGLIIFCIGMIGMIATGFIVLQLKFSQELLAKWFDRQSPQEMKIGWVSKTLPLPQPLPPIEPVTPADVYKPQIAPIANVAPLPLPTPNPSETPAVATDTTPPVAIESPPMQRNVWLTQQPTTNYTLQLNNASSVEEAERYIERNKLADQAFYIEVIEQGEPVYYVLHGVYTTRTEANTAISKLPSNLRKKKPFPVNFKKLQSAIQPH